jgi:hypothetical protein
MTMAESGKIVLVLVSFEIEQRPDSWAAKCQEFGFVVYAESPAAVRKVAVKAAYAYLDVLARQHKALEYLQKHRVQYVVIEPKRSRPAFNINPPVHPTSFSSVLNLSMRDLAPA